MTGKNPLLWRTRRTESIFSLIVMLSLSLYSPVAIHANTTSSRLAGEEVPAVLIAPTVAESGNQLFAQQLLQLLVVRIVNDRIFTVLQPELIAVNLQRRERLPSELEDHDVAMETGFDLGADFVLGTVYTRVGNAGTWSVVLTSTATGRVVWDTIVTVDHQRPSRTVQLVAERLRGTSLEIRLVTLPDVEMLISLGEYERAAALLERFDERRPHDTQAAHVRSNLQQARAEQSYRRAQRFGELGLFDEAFIHINRAIALDPSREEFRSYIDSLRAVRAESERASRDERLTIIARVMDAGYYESAELLLNREPEPEHPDVEELRARLDAMSGAHRAYRRAIQAYWRRDYIVAKAEIVEAIGRDPEQPLYGMVLREIEVADRERREAEELWIQYRRSMADLNIRSMVVVSRTPIPRWEASIGRGHYDYRNRDSLSTTAIPQLVLRGAYFRPRIFPVALDHPAFTFYWGWHAGAVIRVGANEADRSTGIDGLGRVLERDRLWSLGPVGGGSLHAGIFGFSVGAGLELETHLLIMERLERDPLADVDRNQVDAAFVPALKWFGSLAWHWDRRNTLALTLERTVLGDAYPSPSSATEQFRPRSLLLTYGRSLR